MNGFNGTLTHKSTYQVTWSNPNWDYKQIFAININAFSIQSLFQFKHAVK